MTSTTWTFGGGGAAAETFLFPHPPNDRRLKNTQSRTHIFVAKLQQPTEPLLLLPQPASVEDVTAGFEMRNRSHIPPSRFWRSFYSQTTGDSRIDTHDCGRAPITAICIWRIIRQC